MPRSFSLATVASRFFSVIAGSMPRSMSLAPSSRITIAVPSGTDQSSRDRPPLDVSPETLKYLWRGLFGGAGQFAADSLNLGVTLAQGAAPTLRELPGVRKFVREETIQDARTVFREQADQVRAATGAFGAAKRAGDGAAMKDIAQEKAELVRLGTVLTAVSKTVRAHRQAQDQIMASAMPLAQKRLHLREMEVQEAQLYTTFSGLFERASQNRERRLQAVDR